MTTAYFATMKARCVNFLGQFVTSGSGMAPSEEGVIPVMVASVLNSKRAIEVSVYVVRAFVKVREVLGAHSELAQKLTELERRVESHDTHIRSLSLLSVWSVWFLW